MYTTWYSINITWYFINIKYYISHNYTYYHKYTCVV